MLFYLCLPIVETVSRDEIRRKLTKEIAALEKTVKNERQFNRQVDLNGELKRLRKDFTDLA